MLTQFVYYLGRPSDGYIPTEPLNHPAAWTSTSLREDPETFFTLLPEHIDEMRLAVSRVRNMSVPYTSLTKDDFPLPLLSPYITQWIKNLNSGTGVRVIRGVPVKEWNQDEISMFFWSLGLHMGIPGAQNRAGDLLGTIQDTGADHRSPKVRGYLTNSKLGFHCDLADIVGLLCVKTAKQGGTSHMVSTVTIFNEIMKRRPELAPLLFQEHYVDVKGSLLVNWLPVIPVQHYKNKLLTFWHTDLLRTSRTDYGPKSAPTLTQAEQDLYDLIDELTADPAYRFSMDFRPGDIQFLSNHVVMHDREAFVDHDDPNEKRKLYRLWLTLDEPEDVYEYVQRWIGVGRVVGMFSGRILNEYLGI